MQRNIKSIITIFFKMFLETLNLQYIAELIVINQFTHIKPDRIFY